MRRDAFGDDVGQNSWLTRAALERYAGWLELGAGDRLLDVGCGAGGPALHVAALTGCDVVGVDLFDDAIAAASRLAERAALAGRARFVQADASASLPFPDRSFAGVLSIDAVNHLLGRKQVFADWARVLAPGGRIVVTDPLTITGLLDSSELAIRASIGTQVFAPAGENERLLAAAGLTVLDVHDETAELARIAASRHAARNVHDEALRRVEGDEAFDGRQRFFALVAMLAEEGRLSRLVYVAS